MGASSDAERMAVLKQQAEEKLRQLDTKSKQLSESLVQNIQQFESVSNARNYRALLVSQIRLLDTWIKAKEGVQSAEEMVKNMVQSKQTLESALGVVDELHPGVVPPSVPFQAQPARQGVGIMNFFSRSR